MRGPDTGDTTSAEGLYAAILQSVCSHMAVRLTRKQDVVMELRGFNMFVRRVTRGSVCDGVSLADLGNRRLWSRIGPFQTILSRVLTQVPTLSTAINDSATGLHDWAYIACRFARRLMDQVGASGPILSVSWSRPEDRVLPGRPVTSGPELVQRCTAAGVQALRKAVVAVYEHTQKKPEMVRFKDEPTGLRVSWLDAAGDGFHESTLDAMLQPLCRDVSNLIDEEIELRKKLQQNTEASKRKLRDISPAVADAVQVALTQNRPVGVRLCMAHDRKDTPMEAWLYVHPHYPNARTSSAILSVNRGCEEFILQARDNNKFYFPPCLLTARLAATNGGVRIELPLIRQPAKGFTWVHPFTGALKPGSLAGAITTERDGSALLDPSDEAQRLFPSLASRIAVPCESPMCLHGQPERVQRLQSKLQSELSRGVEPDVLAIVTELHDIIRFGITTGHRDNGSGPRGNLPYPLAHRPVTGDLAKRVFSFSFRSPSNAPTVPPPAAAPRRS